MQIKKERGIAKMCKRQGIPVILLSGAVDECSKSKLSEVFTELHCAAEEGMSEAESMQNAFPLLKKKAAFVLERYQRCRLQYRH